MALRSDWQRQLKRAHDELGFRYVRFHGLLSDDMGTLIRDNDELVYSFLQLRSGLRLSAFDRDEAVRRVELHARRSRFRRRTVFSYEANVTPPKDYKQWARLIERLGISLDRSLRREGSQPVVFRSLE